MILSVRPQVIYAPTTAVPETVLSCWHCDAANITECESVGKQKDCLDNAQSCMIEVRKRDGNLESVRIH
jgi:hypothetical protein